MLKRLRLSLLTEWYFVEIVSFLLLINSPIDKVAEDDEGAHDESITELHE